MSPGREERGGVCVRKVRETFLPFHLQGSHQYLFTAQILPRNTVLESTAVSKRQRVCCNRILHKKSVILWRSGYDYTKEEPIPTAGEWTISCGCPGTPGKTDVSCDPFVNPSRTLCYSSIWISSFWPALSLFFFFYQQYQVNCFLLQALIF